MTNRGRNPFDNPAYSVQTGIEKFFCRRSSSHTFPNRGQFLFDYKKGSRKSIYRVLDVELRQQFSASEQLFDALLRSTYPKKNCTYINNANPRGRKCDLHFQANYIVNLKSHIFHKFKASIWSFNLFNKCISWYRFLVPSDMK